MAEWSWPNSRISRVVDADSVDASLTRDIGFGGTVTFPVRLRLNRINAPKISTVRGRTARDFVASHLVDQTLLIRTIKPYKYGGPADRAGEYMAEIILPQGSNLADLLVAAGLATYWDGQGPRPDDD